ncbi:hypothetical protein ACNREK_17730, partial [Ralstonia pseudosolanacearum]
RQQRLQCLPQFIADLLSCHATYNAQSAWRDDLVLLATLNMNLQANMLNEQNQSAARNATFFDVK